MTKRREFLVQLSGAVALAAVETQTVAAASHILGSTPLAIDKAQWNTLINEQFYVHDQTKGLVKLTLIKLTEKEVSSKIDQFAITFRGQSSEALPEGIYNMEHPHIGKFQLHFQPHGQDTANSNLRYRADFCLLT